MQARNLLLIEYWADEKKASLTELEAGCMHMISF